MLGCRYGLIVFLLAVVASGAAASVCPTTGSASGKCLKVADHYWYVERQGHHGPNVVFESGTGDDHGSWDKVVPTIAQFAHTFTYDRSGYGMSPGNAMPATALAYARNLHALLKKADVKPPYILVGHSAGGLYMQMFARLYPKQVAAVVLVDSVSPWQTISDKLPKKMNRNYKELSSFDRSRQQVLHAAPFPAVPLVVLTATWHFSRDPAAVFSALCHGKPCTMTEGQGQKIWVKWQNRLVRLSPHVMHWYAYGSGHHIQHFQPNVVIDAVYTVIRQLRSRRGAVGVLLKN